MKKYIIEDIAKQNYRNEFDGIYFIILNIIADNNSIDKLNTSFVKSKEYILNHYPNKIIYFYTASFLATYFNKRLLKSTLWGKTYPQISNYSNQEVATRLLLAQVKKNGIRFINFCKRYEKDFFFFQDEIQLNHTKHEYLENSLLAFTQSEQNKYLKLLEFLETDDFKFDYERLQTSINNHKFKNLRVWHIENNKYIKNISLKYEFKINKKIIHCSFYDYAVWCTMNVGIDYLLPNQGFHATGLDGKAYQDLTSFFKTYLINETIHDNLISFLRVKALRAKTNKAIWLHVILELSLVNKNSKNKIQKI